MLAERHGTSPVEFRESNRLALGIEFTPEDVPILGLDRIPVHLAAVQQ